MRNSILKYISGETECLVLFGDKCLIARMICFLRSSHVLLFKAQIHFSSKK